jgi:hypothetical protein
MGAWISVDDKAPNKSEPVVYLRAAKGKMSVGVAYWTVSKKWNPEMQSEHAPTGFTHWMPLPEPPIED